jgi:SLA1 homology domain 1, SHD1
VKAKNGFGAELTYQWATILTLEGNTWELVSCVIDDEMVYSSETLLNKLKARKLLNDATQAAADKRAKVEEKKKRAAEIDEKKWHTWTDANGKHTTEAKFSGVASGTVTLIKRDGTSVKVPLEKLSTEDQEWIAGRKWETQ